MDLSSSKLCCSRVNCTYFYFSKRSRQYKDTLLVSIPSLKGKRLLSFS